MAEVVIPNCLVDVMLLVGVDDRCTQLSPSHQETQLKDRRIMDTEYEPQVVSAISGTDMVNFFPFPYKDQTYPPGARKESPPSLTDVFSKTTVAGLQRQSSRTNPFQRSASVNPKTIARTMSIFHSNTGSPAVTIPTLPISDEVIKSIPAFCFPDGFTPHRTKPAPCMHAFILTSTHKTRSYAHCLTFYRSALVTQTGKHIIVNKIGEKLSDSCDGKDDVQCYLPLCCVVISKCPYYSTLKECLSKMLSFIEKDPENMQTYIKDYANILTHTPVPPAGNVAITFSVYDLPVTLMPPTHAEKSVIDLPLHLVFMCFNADVFLQILACILVEERIVFLSSNYALLTIIMESIMNMILPFRWRFTYCTILPSGALGYLESPGTFMYGVHSRHKHHVQQVDGLVIVDIDAGTITIEPEINMEDVEIPVLPSDAVDTFTRKWPQLKIQLELLETKTPFCFNMEAVREQRFKRIKEQNRLISHVCLELMVNLFRTVILKIQPKLKLFSRDELLKELGDDSGFYERVFKTDMFSVFLKQRMEEPSDYFTEFYMKSKGFSASRSSSSLNITSRTGRRGSLHISIKPVEVIEVPLENRLENEFSLPTIQDDLNAYTTKAAEKLSMALKNCDGHDDETSLYYLLAIFYIAKGNRVDAAECFIKVAERNNKILPERLLVQLYSEFTEEEKTTVNKKPDNEILHKIVEDSETSTSGHSEHGVKIRMEPIEIPCRDLCLLDFDSLVGEKEISNHFDTNKTLFKSLCDPHTNMIPEATLRNFILCWDDNQYKCNQITVADGLIGEDETILKVTPVVKSDFGIGRMFLTDKRLFFLQDVSNNYKEIVKLRDIRKLEKSEHAGLLSKTPTLTIHKKQSESHRSSGKTKKGSKKDSTFTVFLKVDRNWWYIIIQEMWAGKIVAEGLKDVMMIHHAIQSVLLIDAVIASGQDDVSTHCKRVAEVADQLSYFIKLMLTEKHILPKDTKDALQTKLDPNVSEKERQSVQALLYIGGDSSTTPMLWVALGAGKIKIYHAVSWMLEKELMNRQTSNAQVGCMRAVGSHVWIGSMGINIYDPRFFSCSQQLMDHQDLVIDIVPYDNGKYVYTASVDGTIIKRNVQKLAHAQEKIKFDNLKNLRTLKIFEDKLVCGSWSSILISNAKGDILNTLKITQEGGMGVDFDGMTVTSSGQVWAGSRREGKVYVWDVRTAKHLANLDLDKKEGCKRSRGVSSIAEIDDKMWIGTKSGDIRIYDLSSRTVWKCLQAHEDAVRVLCDVRDSGSCSSRYIISGGGSTDGRVCIWSPSPKVGVIESGSFSASSE
ncbi:DENN domain-containing protein 3-like isoform X2 [Mya arenaria]|uniref:DENN domain-containing protein 3-like isoform X2 n=3 Tax=Mya arenaria TaxID=6604 RepID=UPI0022E3E719|nr:DENN domain-containing protein 3-like isoform X2 [Mya arenaria]